MTEEEILVRYSTPGLRKTELSRSGKRDNLATLPTGPVVGEEAEVILDRMYGKEDRQPSTTPSEIDILADLIAGPLAERLSQPIRAKNAPVQQSIGFLRGKPTLLSPLQTETTESLPVGFTAVWPKKIVPPTGDVCRCCGGARMIWAGKCKVCQDCGESDGCS